MRKADRKKPQTSSALSGKDKGGKTAEAKLDRLVQKLKQAEEKYRNIVENIGVGISMIDPAMRVLTLNRQMREWFPAVDPSANPLCYKSFNDPPAGNICSYCPTIHTLRDGQVHENVTSTPSGKGMRNYRIIATPITDSGDRVVAAIEMVEDITDRKRAEEALRESEEQFRAMFEVASVGMAQADLKTGQWLRVNEKMCTITGYTPEEMLAMRIPEITHPEDRDRDWDMFQKVVRGERKDYRLEKRYIRKDGQVAWVNVNMTVVRDNAGRPVRTMATIEDITERKQVVEALRLSEQRYRSYIELTGQLGWTTSGKGKIVGDLPAWRLFTGQSEEEMKGEGWAKALHPDDAERAMEAWNRAVATKSAYEIEYRVRRHDGVYRHWLVRSVPLFAEDGEVREWIGTAIDITDMKLAEEKLKKSESVYRTIFETTPAATMIVEEDMTVSMVNREFATQTGYDAGEVEGNRSWTEYILPEDRERVVGYHRLRRMNPEAAPRNYEFRYVDKKGRVRDVYATVALMPGTRKTVLSLLDITERKHDEDALRAMTEELKSKTRALEEMNAALRVLLKQREDDKNELEEKVLATVKELVMPHLGELKKSLSGHKELTHVHILESNLQGIISPFAQKLSLQFLHLTQKEIQIANLIKEGKTSKEIARFMDLSKFAIDTHRAHLRSKLGLVNKKANLRTYLMSISK